MQRVVAEPYEPHDVLRIAFLMLTFVCPVVLALNNWPMLAMAMFTIPNVCLIQARRMYLIHYANAVDGEAVLESVDHAHDGVLGDGPTMFCVEVDTRHGL